MSTGLVNVEDVRRILQDKDLLFFIERNIDEDLVMYKAIMNEARDEITGISVYWCKQSNLGEVIPMTESVKSAIYGVVLRRIKRGLYRMQINCFAGEKEPHFVDLHIKKSREIVPKIIIEGKECTLEKIYSDLTRMPPAINGLWIHGKFKTESVIQKVVLDENIMNKIDISDFMPSLLS